MTDDDISGTFTFLRALEDYGPEITPAQIGQTWFNYIVEGRATSGGAASATPPSTRVYLHLKDGMRAPATGSAALNGKILSEQIGAQIFIDGWAMACRATPSAPPTWRGARRA